MRWSIVFLAAALAFGCSKKPEEVSDSGVAIAAEVTPPTAPATPLALALAVSAELASGESTQLQFGEVSPAVVDPAKRLVVTANLPLRNYRIRVFDEVDKALTSDDLAKNLPDSLRYEIALAEPLKSGHRYSIVLDAQTGTAITDTSGGAHEDRRLELQVLGEKEKPALPKAKAKPKKKSSKRR